MQLATRSTWGHRENVFAFPSSATVSLGESAGLDNSGQNSYTQLFVDTPPGVSYEYTWAQALALGTGPPAPGSPGNADPLVSAQATVGMTCADTTPTLLDCTQDVLFGPGTAATVALSLRASVTGQIPIAATVQYAYPDPVPANNSTSAADAVVPGCTVPKVVGLSVKQATRLITHAHCRLIRATFVPTRSTSLVGRVVSQLPRAGVHLIPDGGVRIVAGRRAQR